MIVIRARIKLRYAITQVFTQLFRFLVFTQLFYFNAIFLDFILQGRLELRDTFKIIENLDREFNFEPFHGKFQTILTNNSDFHVVKRYNEPLKKVDTSDQDYIKTVILRNSPLVSCETERLFSVIHCG